MIRAGLACLVFALPLAAIADEAGGDYIRLVASLDEPEFYCMDIAGWGEHLRLDDPLQTHTCKVRGAADQMFLFQNGRLEVSKYNRCLEVAGSGESTLAGSAVIARPCSDTPLQKLAIDSDGHIRLGDTGYCLGAGAESMEASGPSHMWRTLTVMSCSDADGDLVTWQIGLSTAGE